MKERIMGTECEYALYHQHAPRSGNSAAETVGVGKDAGMESLEAMSNLLVSALRLQNRPVAGEFLGNGGRFYIDRGSHPEYATPECRSVKDLVAHEKAGDSLVRQLAAEAGLLMARNGIPGRLHAFKNNLDPYGNSYGNHENYLVTPQAMERIRSIIPFLISRQIFAGTGKLAGSADTAGEEEDFPFRISQRADFIERVVSDRTADTRGIINIRKREITRREENVRLHVILGDSNLSECALELKIGSTVLVLRVLEESGWEGIPMFSKPVEVLKRISRERQGLYPVEGHGSYSALDIQFIYLEKARKFFASHETGPEEKALLDLWQRTLLGLERLRVCRRTGTIEDDPGELSRKIDWVIKLWLLNRIRETKGLDWRHPHLRHMDFRYHDLDPETGLFERCASLQLVDRAIGEEEIAAALANPPQDTRAFLRGRIIRDLSREDVQVLVENWETIKIVAKGSKSRRIHPFERQKRQIQSFKAVLKDPFESDNPALLARVDRFIEALGEKR